ncbi:hypothetical protein ACYOEI_19470 [Singulisphaera rosea]
MSQYVASYVGVNADTDHGEGWVVFRWPHERYGYEELTIDLDGNCRRRMPIYSGAGPPEFVEPRRDGIRIRIGPALAQKLGLEEEIEIVFRLPDSEFVELRRVVDYFGGLEV